MDSQTEVEFVGADIFMEDLIKSKRKELWLISAPAKFDFKSVPLTIPLNGFVSVAHPDTAESTNKLYKISTEDVDQEITNSAILLPSLTSKKLKPAKKVIKKMTISSIEVAEPVKINKVLETSETVKLETPKRRRSLFFDSKPATVKCNYKVMKKRKKELDDS